ncbi:CheR family methyltransferase [Roseomonas sp. BN140053]|uniref:CheR family methyltransferase n=1 Tax=Roseomonas sp. BN140053 TaxID=3391898 RepID=UPI0039E8DD69
MEPGLEELIEYIGNSRSVDFRGYKRSSLRRRLLKRMEEVGCDSFPAYRAFLEARPAELIELLNTVLINVTAFFRDAEAWDALREEVVPRIVARSDASGQPIRVWSVGCASGEEPFSLAMLFAEALGVEQFSRRVKIYATDLDEAALSTARMATYTPREVESVPAALLERYFERGGNHYTVARELRKCVIFGRHNVVHDAPISRLDLLTCRNLLIYLESETQNAVLPRLHYALAEEGVLFLGRAETQLARSRLFEPVDLKHRLFRKVAQSWRRGRADMGQMSLPALPGHDSQQLHLLEALVDSASTAFLAVDTVGTLVLANAAARRLLEVNENDVGRPFHDLVISYRPAELRGRMEEALRLRRTVRVEHQEHFRSPNESIRLTIELTPLSNGALQPQGVLISVQDTTRQFQLQQDLDVAQQELETTVEELQSANEELETTNEELQSTNEELETTNDELQSANEQMGGTMEELRRQTEESAEYRRYVEAVLRSVDGGVVVLDGSLVVRSWNRWNENTWGLRAEEVVGRPLDEVDIGLPVSLLAEDVQRVLSGDAPELETALEGLDRRGRLLRCRIRLTPLRYEDGALRGVVLMLEDITGVTRGKELADYLGRSAGSSHHAALVLDAGTLRFRLANPAAEQRLGYPVEHLQQLTLADLLPRVGRDALWPLVAPLVAGERAELVFEASLRRRDGETAPAVFCLHHLGSEDPPVLVLQLFEAAGRVQLDAEAGPGGAPPDTVG